MLTILVLSTVPAALAARLDSAALGLVAAAGLLWAGAAFTVSTLPAVPGRRRTCVNAGLAAGLSAVAAIAAIVGLIGAVAGY